jgi:hypothetical protein
MLVYHLSHFVVLAVPLQVIYIPALILEVSVVLEASVVLEELAVVVTLLEVFVAVAFLQLEHQYQSQSF